MNYIQIEIGGKLRGWKVNQMMMELWIKNMPKDPSDVASNYAVVYAGLVANCYVKNEEPDFTFEDVCDWVEELNTDVIKELADILESSQAYIKTRDRLRVLVDEVSAEAEKKNLSEVS